MASRTRPWSALVLGLLVLALGVAAWGGDPAKPPEEAARLLAVGKQLMGQNNPIYAADDAKLSVEARNAAGAQALATFRTVTQQFAEVAEGWMWLGVALTETLVYSHEHPDGVCDPSDADAKAGVVAFEEAYKRQPTVLQYVGYYGEALLTIRRDYDAARRLWETFLTVVDTDLQRMLARVQAARACLNKAVDLKSRKRPLSETRPLFNAAAAHIAAAAKLCPRSRDVQEMQQLLDSLRKDLT
jgi:hypothetical protein